MSEQEDGWLSDEAREQKKLLDAIPDGEVPPPPSAPPPAAEAVDSADQSDTSGLPANPEPPPGFSDSPTIAQDIAAIRTALETIQQLLEETLGQ